MKTQGLWRWLARALVLVIGLVGAITVALSIAWRPIMLVAFMKLSQAPTRLLQRSMAQ